jgi:L-ascorbate metabolism protein UlaG (beta-lactamase superfamily)
MKQKSNQSRAILTLLMLALLCYPLAACSKSSEKEKPASNDNVVQTTTVEDPATAVTTEEEVVEEETEEVVEATNDVRIKYVGNSCFYITFADGTRLLTDPYGSTYESYFGEFPVMEADVLTISHSHSDHISGIKVTTGEPQIIRPSQLNEAITVGDVKITGYASNHVAELGDNTIFVYEEGDIKIVHMGETDIIESPEAREAIKDADVLLTYAGEYGTIKNPDNFKSLEDLNVKVMIPQHYSMDANNRFYEQPTVDEILAELPEGTVVNTANELIVTKDLEKQFLVLTKN